MPQDQEDATSANENVGDGDTDESEVSDVPVLSEATSDNDSDSEDPDDESDDEAIRLHKESLSIQSKRENLHFTHHQFKNDNFPPRKEGNSGLGEGLGRKGPSEAGPVLTNQNQTLTAMRDLTGGRVLMQQRETLIVTVMVTIYHTIGTEQSQ